MSEAEKRKKNKFIKYINFKKIVHVLTLFSKPLGICLMSLLHFCRVLKRWPLQLQVNVLGIRAIIEMNGTMLGVLVFDTS